MLLDWLAYLGESPPVAGWIRNSLSPHVEGGSLEPALAALFLSELETVTRLHFRKQYVPARRESATIRGKVLTAALARRAHRLPAVPSPPPHLTSSWCSHGFVPAQTAARCNELANSLLCCVAPSSAALIAAPGHPNSHLSASRVRDLFTGACVEN